MKQLGLIRFFKRGQSPLRKGMGALGLAGLCLCAQLSDAKTENLDRVIAVVDEDVVLESELNHQLNQVKKQIRQRGELPPEDVLLNQVLEHLVVKRLQLALGARMGIQITEEEIERTLTRLHSSNNLTREQFIETLSQDGISVPTMRKQLRDEIMVQRVQQARVNFRIQITEQEIDNFLSSEEGKFWLSPEYELGHILLSFSSNGRDEDLTNTQAKADAIYEQLSQGRDFRSLAIAHSGGQKALQGGDLGWRRGVELPEIFARELKDMKAGDLSKPFKSGAGFHILKVYNRKGAEETVIEQSKVRHILLKPSEILTDDEAYEQLLEIRDQALEGEVSFEELAKEHSEDIGSMLAGGDLGWSLPGKFVPEFEQTLNNTDIGVISLPFRSQFGWHILKIDDRRDENMTETVVRNRAENLLRSRRFNEELEIWLQELRSQAYVETRIPDLEQP